MKDDDERVRRIGMKADHVVYTGDAADKNLDHLHQTKRWQMTPNRSECSWWNS
jgi:hypothetical protein